MFNQSYFFAYQKKVLEYNLKPTHLKGLMRHHDHQLINLSQ